MSRSLGVVVMMTFRLCSVVKAEAPGRAAGRFGSPLCDLYYRPEQAAWPVVVSKLVAA